MRTAVYGVWGFRYSETMMVGVYPARAASGLTGSAYHAVAAAESGDSGQSDQARRIQAMHGFHNTHREGLEPPFHRYTHTRCERRRAPPVCDEAGRV